MGPMFRRVMMMLSVLALAFAMAACQPSESELMAKGNAAAEAGKYDEALEFYNQVLESNPDNPTVVKAIGDVYLAQNDYEKAIAHFEGAAERAGDNKAAVSNYNALAGQAYLTKAEALWKKGDYRTNPEGEQAVEDAAWKATEGTERQVREAAFALIVALYDYQFESLRQKYDASESEGERDRIREAEFAHIEKIREKIPRPPKELRQRMRNRLRELTEAEFYAGADKNLEEVVKPWLNSQEFTMLNEDGSRIVHTVTITVSEQAIERGLFSEEDTEEAKAIKQAILDVYYDHAKTETVKQLENVVAMMLGKKQLEKSILASRVETFKVDAEEFYDDEETEAKMFKVTGSMAVEELRTMSFDYHLNQKTASESSTEGNEEGADGEGEKAGEGAEGGDAEGGEPAEGGDAPAEGGDAPAEGGDAPAEGGDAEGGEPAEGGDAP